MEVYLSHTPPGPPRPLESSPVNIARMWLRYPRLMDAHHVVGRHLMGPESTLSRRERELAILRIGVLRHCDYEFAQHRAFNLEDGVLSEDEVLRVVEGPYAQGWSEADAALLRAVDEMHDDAFISDGTWSALSASWSEEQLMDFIVLVGRYWMVSTMLNCVGVQLEDGRQGLP
ncbi:carboxymuconolactone decarboxylase family protein [Nocardioides sp.]|uniref:carboxymuconolactone decarboxylase family protein n=1 Tax=Nocardioides sp. TaxID=35761 RepID=UPI003D12CCCA